MNADTRRRRSLIRELVTRYAVGSQEELVALLAAEGVHASQPTVSRDLEVLRIVKPGRRYLPPEPAALSHLLRQFATSISASGNLAVVRTPPGVAGAVASAIDAAELDGVLATVQGDDTVLVVTVEGGSGRAVADRLIGMKEHTT